MEPTPEIDQSNVPDPEQLKAAEEAAVAAAQAKVAKRAEVEQARYQQATNQYLNQRVLELGVEVDDRTAERDALQARVLELESTVAELTALVADDTEPQPPAGESPEVETS